MTSELKPCPFCGRTNTLKLTTAEDLANEGEDDPLPWDHSAAWAVVCDATKPLGPGGCGATGGFMPSEAEAVEVWNARASLSPAQGGAEPWEPADLNAFRQGNWEHPDRRGRIVGWLIPNDDAKRMGADAFCLPREVELCLNRLAATHPSAPQQEQAQGAADE